ncbi:MAG: AAA family ATPase [Coriobacteriia bacterium]|nr:AAA family ATPase [Coriobacteriia bacterium]
MPLVIAVVGKGGVGKTTLSGMLIEHLCNQGKTSILAVDADANSNLNEVLGLEVSGSLGEIREGLDQKKFDMMQNSSNLEVSEMIFEEMDGAITRGKGYDLLVMGRSQGKGCYCYANEILRKQIQRLSASYSYILVDNAAGMEHISRGILPQIDIVIIVSDCSRRGVLSAGRIDRLVKEIGYAPSVMGLVVNLAPDGVLDTGTKEEVENQGLRLIGVVPQSDQVFAYDCDGIPLVSLPESSSVKTALNNIFSEVGL